jgi:hypothetical protein
MKEGYGTISVRDVNYPSSEIVGFPASQNCVNELRAQKGEIDETADVTTGDTVPLREIPERSGPARRQLLKEFASAERPRSSSVYADRPL